MACSYTSTVPLTRHTNADYTQPRVFSCTCTPTLRPRCLQNTGWVLSLPHQLLLQRSLLYTPKPHPSLTPQRGSSGSQSFPSPHSFPGLEDPPPATNPLLSVLPHLYTQKPASRPHWIPSPGPRLASPWDPSPTGLDAAWATPQLYRKPCNLRSFSLVSRPCQPLTTGQTLAKSPLNRETHTSPGPGMLQPASQASASPQGLESLFVCVHRQGQV